MKKYLLLTLFVVTSISLIFNILVSFNYLHANADLNKERANHALACSIITSQDKAIVSLNHQLNPTGTSVTLNRGTTDEHMANCYE
jgi:hypothetical protein